MAGGKGVNVARTLKTLGQPVIATGFAGRRDRARGSSSSSPRRRSSTTSCASARSRARTCGRRPDHGRADRDQRARRRGQPAGGRALPRQAALPRARRRRWSCSPARCRAAWSPTSTPTLIRELRKMGVHDRRRHRRRAAAPGACAPSPTSSRRTSSRPRSSSATSSTTTRTASSPSREMIELGAARGDHDAAGRLRRVACSTTAGPALHRVYVEPREAGRHRRLRRRVPGRLRGRPLQRRAAGRMPALRRRLRRRVRPSAWAPG